MNSIVVIEDDPDILRGLADTLRSECYDVVTSANGEDGYRLVRERQPDLVILDLLLPGMSGYEVCRQIRRHGLMTPVLMLSAEGQEGSRIRGFEAGADDYVTKPFSLRELLGRVRAILRRSEGRADPTWAVVSPERWKQTEKLYYKARARESSERADFLAEACRGDEALRLDVESLLNEPGSDDGFLAKPVLVVPEHMVATGVPATLVGRSLGGYHLQTLLGAGGMGEVYRAHDTTLGRAVAIKVLPSAFTSNADRLARFEREARMLAALSHPNICTIYGFGEADGIRFLILELVDGDTLAGRLAHLSSLDAKGEGLPLRDALSIARQIADGLEFIHDKGIVHRDLKPANIKVTPDGVVKVLDFGLAKAVAVDRSSPDLTRTAEATRSDLQPGAIIGTAAYMSPEQARGLPVDNRTDIWAFGCVLYEILTGRVAFPGETVADTIAKILEREPDWSALPATTPEPIRRLLRRCLTKDTKQRLRDIGSIRIELDTSYDVLPGATVTVPLAASAAPGARRLPLGHHVSVPP